MFSKNFAYHFSSISIIIIWKEKTERINEEDKKKNMKLEENQVKFEEHLIQMIVPHITYM